MQKIWIWLGFSSFGFQKAVGILGLVAFFSEDYDIIVRYMIYHEWFVYEMSFIIAVDISKAVWECENTAINV